MSAAVATHPIAPEAAPTPSRLARAWRSDLAAHLRRSPVALVALALVLLYAAAALLPSVFAPQRVFDLATLDFADAFRPPVWLEGGAWRMPLGADDQGRDVLSSIVYGLRISLFVSVASVLLSLAIGITLGLVAGYRGGIVDGIVMRIADIQLTFPAMLVAVLIDGVVRAGFGQAAHDRFVVWVLVVSIALAGWVQYARTVRGAVMVEMRRDYVQAAMLIGQPASFILVRHILPNVASPVYVLATIQLAVAIILEATLSFVGLGIPPTEPSLGTLMRVGYGYLMSGEWWLALFPGLALLVLVLAVNLLGDWLRDALNPRLR